MEPLSREFGWNRAQTSSGLSTTALFAVPLSPLVGALIDKWGSRRLAIPGVIMTARAYAALSLASGSLTQVRPLGGVRLRRAGNQDNGMDSGRLQRV